MEFKPINTQAELDEVLKARLEREAKKYADYDDLKKRAAEAEKLGKQLEEANATITRMTDEAKTAAAAKADDEKTVKELTERAEKAEGRLLRRSIADEFKIPSNLAERLVGTTEDELRADAKNLSQYITTQGVAPLATVDKPYGNTPEERQRATVDAALGTLLSSMKGE